MLVLSAAFLKEVALPKPKGKTFPAEEVACANPQSLFRVAQKEDGYRWEVGVRVGSQEDQDQIAMFLWCRAIQQWFSNLFGPGNHLEVKTQIDGPLLRSF